MASPYVSNEVNQEEPRRTGVRTFWVVMRDGQTMECAFRHQSAQSAINEARRLALQFPAMRFFVMQCIGVAYTVSPVEWVAADDLPF